MKAWLLTLLLCAWCYVQVNSFRYHCQVSRGRSLVMVKGKNKEELGLSKKAIFKQLKEKLENAAKTPGFFDVGEAAPDIDLICKGNKDGSQLFACPDAQFIQLVLLKKGLKYNLRPTVGEDVPEWITSKKHTLPTLMYKNFSISDPMTIAEYIERTFPYNSLTRQGVLSYQEVLEQTANFYPSVTRYVLNNDPLKEDLLLKKVEDELDRLDKLLRSAPGQFICGVDISLADLYLLPRLFQANIVLDHFKDLEVYHLQSDPTRIALESYLSKVFSLEEMKDKRVAYNSDRVIHAWKLARARD